MSGPNNNKKASNTPAKKSFLEGEIHRRNALVRIGKIALGVTLPLIITLAPTEAKAYTGE